MKKYIYKLNWISTGFLTVNILLFCMMFRAPKKRWGKERYDCAIICGCQVRDDGIPSDELKTRVEKSVELWKAKKVQYLIMSGAAVHNDCVEAEAMKRYAMELGVPEEYILEEKKAVSTYHNLVHSTRMMKYCGFRDCVVVTSGWHLRKADHYARQSDMPYVMVSADAPEGQGLWKTIRLYIQTNLHMYVNMWKGYY